jgi:hypothetical protein
MEAATYGKGIIMHLLSSQGLSPDKLACNKGKGVDVCYNEKGQGVAH